MIYAFIFIALLLLTVINAVIPLPGSSVVTPLLTVFMTPKNAIAFATIYFLISSTILVIVFRKYLRKEMVKTLLPASLVGAVAGAYLYVFINEMVALVIVLLFVIYFTYKKIVHLKKKSKPSTRMPKTFIGLVSGFFQGGGFAGGDMRNGYLFAKGLNVQEVRATTAAVGASNFLVATLIRGLNGQLDYNTLWLLIPLAPVLIAGTLIGRHVTLKLTEKWQSRIIVGVLLLSILVLIVELVSLTR